MNLERLAARMFIVEPLFRRLRGLGVGMVGVSVVLAGCGSSSPTGSGEPSAPSETPTASQSSSAPSAEPPSGNAPPACLDAKLVWADALGQLLLTNCLDQSDLASVETIWAWDGAAWELLSDEGPPGHVVTGFAWDSDRDVLVRYGGIPLPSQDCVTETWEWDTAAWREVAADPPEPCDHLELAWDASAGRMVLGGGGRAQDLVEGTWTWDGAAWSQLADAGPAPRAHHGLVAHDPGALLYGGLDNSHVFGDLWAWDGSAWAEVTVEGATPGPRSHHGLGAGPAGVLLFGGATNTSTFAGLVDETWLLAEGTWTRLTAPGPSARGLPALGYDPDRDAYVLYGGFDGEGTPLADTWEWDGAWRCVTGC